MDQKRAKAGFLPGDFLFNVFLKLSFKTLLYCRCVCKTWHQLICDHVFVKLYFNQHHKEKLLLLSYNYGSLYSFKHEEAHGNAVPRRDFPFKALSVNEILGSCNGLLCLALKHKRNNHRYPKLLEIALWNPATGDYRLLPVANPPIDSIHMVGFGYDLSVNDYKIVRIITHDNKSLRVDIYTLKTNSWEVINQDVVDCNSINFFSNRVGCAVNKCIYWVGSGTIICFDLENSKFRMVSLPWDPDRGSPENLMVMGGRLCIHDTGPLPYVDEVVWTLVEDEQREEWVKLMTISSRWTSNHDLYRPRGPVCCLENGKILLCREEYESNAGIRVGVIVRSGGACGLIQCKAKSLTKA
ncbi:hypothetical protein LguiA_031097 [Lonicera macranthoides]